MLKSKLIIIECLAFLFFSLLFIGFLYRPLFFADGTFSHDNLWWNYPFFYYFADCLMHGVLPLWNSHSHAGEPFYPLMGQLRLFEPVTILTILIGKYFTQDITLLFNWHRTLNIIVMIAGLYLVIRRYADSIYLRILILPVLFLSSISTGSMRGDGILNSFQWAPFVAFFCLRLFEDRNVCLRNWLGLALSLGIGFQSYFFAGPFILFFILMLAFGFFRPLLWKEILKSKPQRLKIFFSLLILILMVTPSLVLVAESRDYIFPGRMLPSDYMSRAPIRSNPNYEGTKENESMGVFLPYSAIDYAGTPSSEWDYLDTLTYRGRNWLLSMDFFPNLWGSHSESYIYLGILPWAIMLFGIFFGSSNRKTAWGVLTVLFIFITLGSRWYVHRILYYFLPPLWFVRHTAHLTLYVQMGMLFFLVIGLNRLFSFQKTNRKGLVFFIFLLLAQAVGNAYFMDEKTSFWIRILICFGGPFFLYWLLAKSRLSLKKKQSVLFINLLILVVWDLGFHLFEVRLLYQEPVPHTDNKVNPPILNKRVLSSSMYQFEDPYGKQPIRNAELITKEDTLFSPIKFPFPSTDAFERERRGVRWDSLLLLKGYFRLVNSKSSSQQLKTIMMLGKSPYEYQAKGSVTLKNSFPGFYALKVNALEPGRFYLAEGWHSGWIAKVNGKVTPIERVFENFQAITLNVGVWDVDFTFVPTHFLWATLLFFTAIVCGTLGMVFGR